MSKRQRRTLIDVLLTITLVFEMFYQFTGNLLHELVGFAMFACVIVHLALSRRWIASTFGPLGQKALNRQRKRLKVMATLLFIDAGLLAFSSIVISHTLWGLGINLSALDFGGIWTVIHTATAYGLCIFALVHLAMHWVAMAKVFRIEYDPARRQAIGQGVSLVVGVGAIALGVTGSAETADALVAAVAANNAADPAKQSQIEGKSTDPATQDKQGPSQEELNRYEQEQKAERERKRNTKRARNETDNTNSGEQGNADEQESQPEDDWSQDETTAEATTPEETWSEPTYEEEAESSWDAAGICTLCRKQCSLAAPGCNLPYEYGLI